MKKYIALLLVTFASSYCLADSGNSHGHYSGEYLICDDGYKAGGSKCNKLPSL